MQTLLILHNIMRWIVLLFAVLTIFMCLSGMSAKKKFTPGNKRLALLLMTSFDLQLLIGLGLYFMGGLGYKLVKTMGMGEVMKEKTFRFFSIEHPVGMLIALILIHAGYSAVKKNIADQSKFKRLFWFSFLALIVVLATVPWPFREAVGRPWFREIGF